MSVNRSHHVLHRMVPLICQALTSSNDETVWLDGLRLLASPKLKTALSITASIWLPLLLKGLDVSRSSAVNTAGLILLSEVADQLKPMKSCLAKPLKALSRDAKIGNSQELVIVLLRLDMEVSPGLGPKGSEGRERRAARSIGVSHIILIPTPPAGLIPPDTVLTLSTVLSHFNPSYYQISTHRTITSPPSSSGLVVLCRCLRGQDS
jgi:hypothetical protein